MNIEHRYIVKLIKELEEKNANIESITTGDIDTVAELRQENLVLSKQVEHSAEKQVEQEENAKKLMGKIADLQVENDKLKNENWELFTYKDNQDKLNKAKIQSTTKELKEENEALKNRVNEMKEQLKVKNTPAPEEEKEPVTHGNTYTTLEIFQRIKEGSLIKELTMINGRGKGSRMSSHPFVFELGNCAAFFNETKNVACLEKGDVNTYIPIDMKGVSKAVTSSMREYIGINMDFKVAQRKDLKGHSTTIKKVLECKQLISKEGYLCSHEQYTWYIYQENDGSKFVVLPNGEKEVV